MELGAAEINEQQFHDAWRGYNQEEVDDFLDRVAEVLDRAQRENEALSQRIGELEEAVATTRRSEEMMKRTLAAAQRAAEEAIAKAKARAERLVAEAEERARRADNQVKERIAAGEIEVRRKTLEAEQQHNLIRRELEGRIDRLRQFEAELKRRLQTLLRQQLRDLELLLGEERSQDELADAGTEDSPSLSAQDGGEAEPVRATQDR